MKFHKIAFILLVIGGLNWGLELFGIGIGNYLPDTLTKVIYALVAVSALSEIFAHKSLCKHCSAGSMQAPAQM